MIRTEAQSTAANTLAGQLASFTHTDEAGVEWRFHALAPRSYVNRRRGSESVWLVNGAGEFKHAGIIHGRAAFTGRPALATPARTSLPRYRGTSGTRVDGSPDVTTNYSRVLSSKSPGCTCPDCGSPAARKEALVRHAI